MPSRRTLLATVGSALAMGGCQGLGFGSPGDDATPTPSGTDAPSDRTDTPPDRTDAPPATRRPDVLDLECPSFAQTDETYCAYAIPPEIGIRFDVSTHVFEPVAGNDTVETITFALTNETKQAFTLNPHAWSLHRFESEEWTRVAPDEHFDPLQEVPRRGTYEWVLSREPHPTENGDQRLYPTVDVEAGSYAFAVDGWLGDADAPESERITYELIARFEVRPSRRPRPQPRAPDSVLGIGRVDFLGDPQFHVLQ